MTSLRAIQVFGFAALAGGIIVAFLIRRVPMRGWAGVVLLMIASGAWALIDQRDDSQPSSLPMFIAFLFVSPIAIVYSFRARRLAPDRVIARAAFAGSFLVAAFLLFMTAGIAFSFFFDET